jgi:hypothetical protein
MATVGGGIKNIASSGRATVGGGAQNTASGEHATVGGGLHNIASGGRATVPGGAQNTAQGNWSFAAGRGAKAFHEGAFVWADSTDPFSASIYSPAPDTFIVRADGGIWFGQANTVHFTPTIGSGVFISTSTGAYLSTSGIWTDASDRDLKENFTAVDRREVLARVAEVPITTWNYKAEDQFIRHMGPTAQDFYAAFALGRDDRHIASLDANGVALAAVQGLYELSQEQAARIQTLEAENAALRSQMDNLEARMVALEAASANSTASAQPLQSGLLPGAGVLLAGLGLVWFNRRGGALSLPEGLSKGGGR